MKPRLYIDQKITAWVNRYRVYEPAQDGAKSDQLICFVEQKRGKLKEKVNFFADDEKSEVLFSFRAEKVMDVHGKYFVEDATGTLLGYFKKDFKQSFVKSTWHLYDSADKQLLTITESNPVLAVIRRYFGLIPIIGEFIELIVALFRYHFVFLAPGGQAVVGKFEKLSIWRDHYKLSTTDEIDAKLDRRVITAMGVALDALQSR